MTSDNSGFEQPNYTQTPNALFDKYLAEIDSMTELKVVLAIIRKTLGWHKTRDVISITQLEKMTALSRQGVIDGIEKAAKRGLIGRQPAGQGFTYYLLISETQEPASQNPLPATSPNFRPVGETSQNFGLPLVNNLDQQLVNNLDIQKKGLNKSFKESGTGKNPITTARPPKSEAILIEEYFLEKTTGSIGFMSPIGRDIIKDLVEKGFTLDRCKPGIDQTLSEMQEKHKTIGSIKLCVPAIIQLDPVSIASRKPTPINQNQSSGPGRYERRPQPQLTAWGTPYADTDNLPWYPKEGEYGKDFYFTAKEA